ncbi:hypothetical protein ACS0TY_033792 [Phlomoides rotata]
MRFFQKGSDGVCEIAYGKKEQQVDFLDSLLLGEVISGKYGFIAQLNEGRHFKKRPIEFCVDKVLQPFDESKFNFTKVGQEEVLFQFEASEDDEVHFYPNAPIDVDNSPSVVAINGISIEYGHVLLIPRILERLPQRIDSESFLLPLHMAVKAGNPYFRLGYNSLGAFETINHLHFQAYYLAMLFPIEKAPSKQITVTSNGVEISDITSYPVRGLIFEGGNTLEDYSMSSRVLAFPSKRITFHIMFSLLILGNGFPFPTGEDTYTLCYAEKQALGKVSYELLGTQVNPAVWEISGHMVLKRKEDYEEACEQNAWRLLPEVSLSEERLQEVKELMFEAICCKVEEKVVESDATPLSHEDVDDL